MIPFDWYVFYRGINTVGYYTHHDYIIYIVPTKYSNRSSLNAQQVVAFYYSLITILSINQA